MKVEQVFFFFLPHFVSVEIFLVKSNRGEEKKKGEREREEMIDVTRHGQILINCGVFCRMPLTHFSPDLLFCKGDDIIRKGGFVYAYASLL